jgi:L-threonylcarbamoyladenylate synthase
MTAIVHCGSNFSQIGEKVRNGSVVIFPTDTVYGLGSSPLSIEGIKSCYSIKKRDSIRKMPVLFLNYNEASKFVRFGEKSSYLASILWPGKLTLVLQVINPTTPVELVGTERTLAVRVPNHGCCLDLISACGGSLIGTSANISGEKSLVDPDDPVLRTLSESADFFVSGYCGDGSLLPSTIVDATDEKDIKITREGAISSRDIFTYLENMRRTDISSSAT